MLDRRPDGHETAVVVAGAEEFIERLRREGVEHRVVDLNLDEIFEAYVAGRKDGTQDQPQVVDLQSAGSE